MIYLLSFIAFIVTLLTYFIIAKRFNIIDKPNDRSSHSDVTIRGGGIVFLLAAIILGVVHPDSWLFVLSILIIGLISFIDDRITLSSRIRLLFHLTAVSMIFFGLNAFALFQWWELMLLYITIIGIINAYNFMDGINGMTGVYSIVVLTGIQVVNHYIHPFIHQDYIWMPLLALLAFSFFNFRTKAVCFAGDVGSISLALWIVFLLFKLILESHNAKYILFLSIYGVDTVMTIMHRIILKQNIFAAHRLHFYQVLANERNISHLTVSLLYAFMQLAVILLVLLIDISNIALFVISLVPFIIMYIYLKPKFMLNKAA